MCFHSPALMTILDFLWTKKTWNCVEDIHITLNYKRLCSYEGQKKYRWSHILCKYFMGNLVGKLLVGFLLKPLIDNIFLYFCYMNPWQLTFERSSWTNTIKFFFRSFHEIAEILLKLALNTNHRWKIIFIDMIVKFDKNDGRTEVESYWHFPIFPFLSAHPKQCQTTCPYGQYFCQTTNFGAEIQDNIHQQ